MVVLLNIIKILAQDGKGNFRPIHCNPSPPVSLLERGDIIPPRESVIRINRLIKILSVCARDVSKLCSDRAAALYRVRAVLKGPDVRRHRCAVGLIQSPTGPINFYWPQGKSLHIHPWPYISFCILDVFLKKYQLPFQPQNSNYSYIYPCLSHNHVP